MGATEDPGAWSHGVCPNGWITAHDAAKILQMNRTQMYRLCYALIARWGKDDPCSPRKFFFMGMRPARKFWMLHRSTFWFLMGRKTALRYGEHVLRGNLRTRRSRMPSLLRKFLLPHDLRSRTSAILLSISSSMPATGSPDWLQKLRGKGKPWSPPSR